MTPQRIDSVPDAATQPVTSLKSLRTEIDFFPSVNTELTWLIKKLLLFSFICPKDILQEVLWLVNIHCSKLQSVFLKPTFIQKTTRQHTVCPYLGGQYVFLWFPWLFHTTIWTILQFSVGTLNILLNLKSLQYSTLLFLTCWHPQRLPHVSSGVTLLPCVSAKWEVTSVFKDSWR